ncbi:MAG: HD-like signal output (HDOD) protein [Pseudohongiellaceae bacterium]|jgi:HD-like signal output (HDOD) protein
MEAAASNLLPTQRETIVRSILLQDRTGRVQAILSEHSLLDLKNIRDQTGRDLVAVSPAELDAFYSSERLTKLSNIPELNNVTTLLDQSIAADKLIIISSSDNPETKPLDLAVLQKDLLVFNHDMLTLDIAVCGNDLSPTPPNLKEDAARIVHSLKTFTSIRIKQRLEDTLEIPTLPATAQRIIELRVNPNAVVSDLSEIVESDPSLAAQVVSWAASPYYAAPGKIRSVQDAIVRVLGFDLVGNLALGLALGKTLELPKDKVDGETPYWLQSIYCSTLVEAIVTLIPPEIKPSKGLTYLSGLLHNFGYLVLAHIFPPHFSQICRYIEANPHISHMAIENHLLQITREQICLWLMDLWNMPEEIKATIQFQHDPTYSGRHCAYPNLIFMALRLLKHEGIGDAPLEEVPDELFARYQLNREDVMEKVREVVESAEEISSIAKNFPS